MTLCLIQVPYVVGNEHHPGSKGPESYLKAVSDAGLDVAVERVERGGPFRDSTNASLLVNRQIAQAVGKALDAGQLPLTVGGSCDVSLGVLAGFEHARCGVVWLDAHGDFNTPETTVSGYFPGMPLAVIAGECYRALWANTGHSEPIDEPAILLIGARDLDPLERERLERSEVRCIEWRDGKPQADLPAALDALADRVEEVYLHIDCDALDPQAAPGIIDFTPVPGGMSLADVENIIREVGARFRVRAAALTTFNPELDREGRTLKSGLRIIELLGETASSQSQTE